MSLEIIERPFLWTMFFWFSGMASLATWNAILSQNAYWIPKFKDGIDAYYPFFYFGGAVSSFFLYDCINRILSFKMQLSIIPSVMVLAFYALYIIGENQKEDTNLKVFLFQAICFVVGFINNVLQTTVNKFAFNFRLKDITAMTSGTALVGVIQAQVGFIQNITLPTKLELSFIIYQIFVTIFMVTGVVIFQLFIEFYYSKELRESNKIGNKSLLETCSQDLVNEVKYDATNTRNYNSNKAKHSSGNSIKGKVVKVININESSETWKERCVCFKDLYSMMMMLILCYSVTLSVFPKLIFDDFLLPEGSNGGFALAVFIYNVGDFVGKYSYNWIRLKDNISLLVYVVARAVIFPGFYIAVEAGIFGGALKSWWLNYIMLVALSITNGHITSGAFALGADRLEGNKKRFSGFFMVMALLLGLLNGSFIAFVVNK